MRQFLPLLAALLLSLVNGAPARLAAGDGAEKAPGKERRKKIVILAGKKSHGPEGNGIHDYGWSARLLKVMLEHSNIKDQVRVEVHQGGWPRNPSTLDDANAILVISDGRDGDSYQEAPHLASPERVRYFASLMKKGCGFLTFHFSTFAPDRYAGEMLDWSGGYFDWEEDGKRKWYSAITTREAAVQLASPDHPISRGLKPLTLREEFYYNLRFRPGDEALKPIWVVPSLEGRKPDGNVVAWARQRKDGGRGFGTTCGHFYDNWKNEQFRKLILNALAWCAEVDVPTGGVEARFYTHEEIRKAEEGAPGKGAKPISILLIAGNAAHRWHNWEKTTPAIKWALERDKRMNVDVSYDFEDLGRKKLDGYPVIVLNYCNWQDPKAPSEKVRRAFLEYVSKGGGLIVIHFANGAFHPSLPGAGASDWPEYRQVVRRVWNHQKREGKPPSGHDAFGKFTVRLTKADHPLTKGLKPFEVEDELYHNQDGEQPVEVLLSGLSRDTKRMEPLAWVYRQGKARVFQTVLGHSEKTWNAFEARELLRRAAAWTANQEVRFLEAGDDPWPPR